MISHQMLCTALGNICPESQHNIALQHNKGCGDISINRFIPVFAVQYGLVISLAAYRYKGKQLKHNILK